MQSDSSLHPRQPGDPFDILRLIRSRRVGPATFHRLIAEHGTAMAALGELPAIARAAGIDDYAPCPPSVIKAELVDGRRAGARLVVWGDADYPTALYDITDAPPALWLKGTVDCLQRPQIAVIGARNASSLGLRMGRGLARGLAEAGVVVVAGLARGIDTVAHEASLETGTIAVMAGGIDAIYPHENKALATSILEGGLLISEQPPGVEPTARHFPARNRIISGLSRGVVVVEAAFRSGSLITAKNALDQGREVMAVPGHPMDARAAGCNQLIREGAILVRNSDDVLAALDLRQTEIIAPVEPAAVHAPMSQPAPPVERMILARLGPTPIEENALLRDLGIAPSTFATAILSLELNGAVQRVAGGGLALAIS